MARSVLAIHPVAGARTRRRRARAVLPRRPSFRQRRDGQLGAPRPSRFYLQNRCNRWDVRGVQSPQRPMRQITRCSAALMDTRSRTHALAHAPSHRRAHSPVPRSTADNRRGTPAAVPLGERAQCGCQCGRGGPTTDTEVAAMGAVPICRAWQRLGKCWRWLTGVGESVECGRAVGNSDGPHRPRTL